MTIINSKITPESVKEYNEEALRQIAWDHSTKLMMYTEETFKRALERNNSIFQRLSNDSAISNMNSSDISVLLDLKALKTEIEMLESEIAVEATTAEQNELIDLEKVWYDLEEQSLKDKVIK